MAEYMTDEMLSELRVIYKNNLSKFCDEKSLQYACFKQWIKCFNLTKVSINQQSLPPVIKYIIQNYCERLVCDYCGKLTWDFDHRINHVKEEHMEEIYAILSGIQKYRQ